MAISPALSTKVKAMSGHILSPETLLELKEQKQAELIISLRNLKPHLNWPKDGRQVSASEVEDLLNEDIISDFLKIYRFATYETREMLTLYGLQFEVAFIKHCLNDMEVYGQVNMVMDPFLHYLDKTRHYHVEEILLAKNYQEFIHALRDTLFSPFFKKISDNVQFQLGNYDHYSIDSALDRYRAELIRREVKKLKDTTAEKDLLHFYGTKYDLINLNTIYRLKFLFHEDEAAISEQLFTPYRKVGPIERSQLLIATSVNHYQNIVDQLGYSEILDYQKEAFSVFAQEKHLLSLIHTYARQGKGSILEVYAYLQSKELESRVLIRLLELSQHPTLKI